MSTDSVSSVGATAAMSTVWRRCIDHAFRDGADAWRRLRDAAGMPDETDPAPAPGAQPVFAPREAHAYHGQAADRVAAPAPEDR